MGETGHWPEMRRRSSGEISAASSLLLVDPSVLSSARADEQGGQGSGETPAAGSALRVDPCNTDLRIEGRRIDEPLDPGVEDVPGALALDPGPPLAAAELPLREKGREHAREALL